MGQFGMQMPGSQTRRKASPDVYTLLLLLACLALAAACTYLYIQGGKVSTEAGNPFAMQDPANVRLPQ